MVAIHRLQGLWSAGSWMSADDIRTGILMMTASTYRVAAPGSAAGIAAALHTTLDAEHRECCL